MQLYVYTRAYNGIRDPNTVTPNCKESNVAFPNIGLSTADSLRIITRFLLLKRSIIILQQITMRNEQ